MILKTALFIALITCAQAPGQEATASPAWGPWRGMTMQLSVSDADIRAFAATGANLIRLGFSDSDSKSGPPRTRSTKMRFDVSTRS